MAHVRLEYTHSRGREMVIVEVLAGPALRAIRPVGRLVLHPAELNALDRLLSRGAFFEAPANSYAIERSERDLEAEPQAHERSLIEHVEDRLARVRS